MEPLTAGAITAGMLAVIGFLLKYSLAAKDKNIESMQKQIDDLYDAQRASELLNNTIETKLDNVIDLIEKLDK